MFGEESPVWCRILQDKQDLRCHEVNQGWGKVRRDWRDRPSSHWPQSSGLHSLSRHSGLASLGPRPGVIITSICPGGDRQEEWQECRVVTTVQPGPGRHQATPGPRNTQGRGQQSVSRWFILSTTVLLLWIGQVMCNHQAIQSLYRIDN